MRPWAVGVVYMYVGVQLFNWVTGLYWLSELALPMTILAGLSLAIASQPSTLLPDAAPKIPDPKDQVAATPLSETGLPQPDTTENSADASISFTIRKNVRPR